MVCLYREDVDKRLYVHRIVLAAFVGPCPTGSNVNHLDAVKENNRLSNLHYATFSENMQHAHDHGLMNLKPLRGEKNPKATITEAQAVQIISFLRSGLTPTEIGKCMGINRMTIYPIHHGATWTHLPRKEPEAVADC